MASCWYCDGTGQYKQPNDEEAFDRAYDRFDDMGMFDGATCRRKALAEVGYTIVDCPNCKGTGESGTRRAQS